MKKIKHFLRLRRFPLLMELKHGPLAQQVKAKITSLLGQQDKHSTLRITGLVLKVSTVCSITSLSFAAVLALMLVTFLG